MKAATTLAESIDESLANDRGDLLVVIVDKNGSQVAIANAEQLCHDGEFSKDQFLELLRQHLTTPLDAPELLAATLAQAKSENKRVLVQETATWCGPCHLFLDFLNKNRIWEKDYVWVKMDHRWTGANELMEEIRKDANGGVPWYAILDDLGNVMATSDDSESKQNIGLPSNVSGKNHFARMLKEPLRRLMDEQIDAFVALLKSDN